MKMTVGQLNLTVFSSALLCFGTVCATPAQAVPQRPWYLAAFDRVLRVVHTEGTAADAAPKDLQNIEQPYVTRIVKEDGSITIKGKIPTEGDLKILQGVAAATSPGLTLNDNSLIDAAVPDHDNWLAAMTFALRQLGKLESGQAHLNNRSIAIEGITKSGDDFAAVQKKLRDEAPKALELQASIKQHDVHPFVWFAQLQAGSITLSGHVPDKQDNVLCSHAQGLFQNLKVNNTMQFANGQPRDWLAAAKVALDMLSLLYAGNAEVSENVVRLEGIYASSAMAAVLKSYSERLPAGFKLETNILERVPRGPGTRAEDVNLAAHTATTALNP
jgi:hypothetical protein